MSDPHASYQVSALGDADDERLGRLYALMEMAFPPAELMTYEELLGARDDPATGGTIMTDGGQVVAGCVTEQYLGGRVVLLAYLVVAPPHRNGGIGSQLLTGFAELGTGTDPPLLLAEIEDPRFYLPSEGHGDPSARVRFYDRAGCRLLPLAYEQPSLRAGSPRAENLLLIAIGASGDDVDGELVAAFLDEYYEACEVPEAVQRDPTYRALRALAVGDDKGRLKLYSLADLCQARPSP